MDGSSRQRNIFVVQLLSLLAIVLCGVSGGFVAAVHDTRAYQHACHHVGGEVYFTGSDHRVCLHGAQSILIRDSR